MASLIITCLVSPVVNWIAYAASTSADYMIKILVLLIVLPAAILCMSARGRGVSRQMFVVVFGTLFPKKVWLELFLKAFLLGL